MPRYEPLDWYENARYYDIVFDADTPGETAFLEAVHEQHARSRGRRVLEPACGSGRLLLSLARRGWTVTGFDLSDGMLKFARQRLKEHNVRARLVNASMQRFSIPGRFDLAHCLVSTFKYLTTEADARAHLQRVAKSLAPGGIYVLALHLTDYARTARQRERWIGKRRRTHVVCNLQGWPADRRARLERVRARLIVTEHGTQRHFESHWTFRTYSLRQLKSLLKSVPTLEHVATYDFTCDINHPRPFDGRQDDVILILRRR